MLIQYLFIYLCMENFKDKEFIEEEFGKQLLSELITYNRRLTISKILIILTLIVLPSILVLDIMSIINSVVTMILVPITLLGLMLSIRMYNHNKVYCHLHTWILDGSLMDKTKNPQNN